MKNIIFLGINLFLSIQIVDSFNPALLCLGLLNPNKFVSNSGNIFYYKSQSLGKNCPFVNNKPAFYTPPKAFLTDACELSTDDNHVEMCQMDLSTYFDVVSKPSSYLRKLRDNMDNGLFKIDLNIPSEKNKDIYMANAKKEDMQAFVYEDKENNQVAITIPGTKSLVNVIHDIQLKRKITETEGLSYKIHAGFMKSFESVLGYVISAIKKVKKESPNLNGITIFGHSLGGAVGILLARELTLYRKKYESAIGELPINLFTIGCPPVSSPSIPMEHLGGKVYHMYISGDVVVGMGSIAPNVFAHAEGIRVPLIDKYGKGFLRHKASLYYEIYKNYVDTCSVDSIDF